MTSALCINAEMIGFFCVYKEEKDMLISIAFMLMLGMFLGWVCRKLRLPGLMGMIFTGVLLGPYALNLIDGSILNISSELRRIALIIILMRAGLSLDLNDLKKVGRPAVLMCFLPACFENWEWSFWRPGYWGFRFSTPPSWELWWERCPRLS